MKEFGVSPRQTALIGDQLFTDILCGNLCGCVTILVEPYAEEGYGLYRIKRPLENRCCAFTTAAKGGMPNDKNRACREQRKLYRHGL